MHAFLCFIGKSCHVDSDLEMNWKTEEGDELFYLIIYWRYMFLALKMVGMALLNHISGK